MEVTFPELGYRLAPHNSGLCWEMFEWKDEREVTAGKYAGNVAAAGWVSLGIYPTTVEQGVARVYDFATLKRSEKVQVRDLLDSLKAVRESILSADWSPASTGEAE